MFMTTIKRQVYYDLSGDYVSENNELFEINIMTTQTMNAQISTNMIRNAVFDSGKRNLKDKLFARWFDGFVYNQIWEDPDVDLKALQVDERSSILTISSGGCNLLNYLLANPKEIHAVDLNRNHLHLANLKITALRHLPNHEAFFQFFGKADTVENVENYVKYLKPHLEKDAQAYWEKRTVLGESRIQYFANNLYRYGAMGKFIGFLHRFARRYHIDLQEFLSVEDVAQREKLFDEKFSSFFTKRIVSFLGNLPLLFFNLGIPPKQFEYMKKEYDGDLTKLYHERVKRLVCDFPIEENYFAWQAFSRRYDCKNRKAIPNYLKAENYEHLKQNVHKISLNLMSLTDFLARQSEGSVNRFVFLDSLDWMDAWQIHELWREVYRVGEEGSRVIFRTSSNHSPVEELLSSELLRRFTYHKDLSEKLFREDRSAIYGGFHLYESK